MRRWMWWALLIAGLALGFLIVRAGHASRSATPPPPEVTVAVAKSGHFDVRVEGQGRVGPPAGSSSSLAFAVSGTIAAIDVRVGDHVAAGQPLAHLDDTPYALAVQQAIGDARSANSNYGGGAVPQAALRSAEERVRLTGDYLHRLETGGGAAAVAGTSQADLKVEADKRALAREEALYAGGIAAAKDVEAARSQLAADEADASALHAKSGGSNAGAVLVQARADYAQAQADLRSAQAQIGNLQGQAEHASAALAQAESDEARTVLRAPSDGIVVQILKHAGESADTSTPVIVIGPGAAASTTLYVAAADAVGIRTGDPVQLRLIRSASDAGAKVSAVVPAIDPTSQQTTVVVDGMPAGALPGDAVRGEIIVSRQRGVLVPAASIVQDPQSGKTLVFVRRKDGSGFDAREVVVAGSDSSVADISSGLQPGESVAAHGAYELMSPSGPSGD